jgi:hypothetical protein
VSESEKSQLVNETHWQYYGTSDTRGNLNLTWDTSALPTPAVTIELWGYEETGGACQGLDGGVWNFQTLRCERRSLRRGWRKGCGKEKEISVWWYRSRRGLQLDRNSSDCWHAW